jgi:MobA/VirD2-like, nuclease domain
VIGKVLRGRNVRRLLYYLYGPGLANEHADPHLVAGFGDPAGLEPERRPGGTRDFRRLSGLLEQPLAGLRGRGYDKPVWHCAVRAAPEDRMLSDAEWALVAARVMHRTGLALDDDDLGVRWVAVRHAADHIHIVATLARQDGRRASTWNDYYRVREACHDAERRFGLRPTAPADRTAARRPARAETEQAARRGWAEPPRVTVRREVCTAAAGAGSAREFFARLRAAGVLVRERYSTVHPDQVAGYAVGLPGHTARDGGVVWYGGGKLAADLTLPKLRARWAGVGPGRVPFSGTGVPASAVRGALRSILTNAAEQAGDEVAFFARLREAGVLVRVRFSETDPGQVTGYSVTLPGHAGPDGAPLWYGGGRLAAGLTVPRLRDRWNRPADQSAERSGTPRFTAPERDEIYRHAARQARAAAEHIRHCAMTDPAGAADAAWAAADTLYIAARALRNPHLRCAAASYDRAARAPYGRIPARSRDGEQLRRTARMIALAGNLTGDNALMAIALVAQLVALAAAVAELRQAQQHAAQATAARDAAAQLNAAVKQARVHAPHFGHAQSHRPNRVANAVQTARRDFPAGMRPTQSATNEPEAARPRLPRRVHPPPRRAGPSP